MIVALLVALAGALVDDEGLMLRARIDPFVTVVAGGASVGIDVAPRSWPTRLSAATFVVEVPRLLVPLINRGGSSSLQIVEQCVQFGAFTSLSAGHRGFFVGPEVYAYQLRYVDSAHRSRHATARELYAHVTAGWTWFPFADGDDVLTSHVFLMPWATLGVPVFGSGGVVFADGSVVRDRVINFHATVSLGLEL